MGQDWYLNITKPDIQGERNSITHYYSLNMAKKVLVATEKPFAKKAVDGIREVIEKAGYELKMLEKYTDKAQLLEAVADVDALIIRSPGQNANAVAELTIAMMVFMARNGFNPGTGMELRGKRLGIVAYGAIGRIVADVADGFGMYVHVYSRPNPNKVRLYAKHLRRDDSLEQMFSESNFVWLDMPATADTKGMIGYDLIKLMPAGGILVNTARKELVDEEGLIRAFEERSDLKYITDIAPVRIEEMKEKFGNRVFATPKKMGAETAEANINAAVAAATQIVGFFENGDVQFQGNK